MIPVFIEIHGEQTLETAEDRRPDVHSFRVSGKLWRAHDGYKITYREPEETGAENTVTTITVLREHAVSVNRVGYLNAGMIFEEGVTHVCVYDAGFLQLQVTLRTHQLTQTFSESGGCIDIDYSIEIGGRSEGRNRLMITVTPAVPPAHKPRGRDKDDETTSPAQMPRGDLRDDIPKTKRRDG